MRWQQTLLIACMCLTSLLCSSSTAFAEKLSSWRGYLVDRSCRGSVEGDSNALTFAREHSKSCSLMSACQQAGYAIYSDGKWFNLDRNGNELAKRLFKASKRDKHFYVQVDGSLTGQAIVTQKITEIPEAPSKD